LSDATDYTSNMLTSKVLKQTTSISVTTKEKKKENTISKLVRNGFMRWSGWHY
jgi:hypothetical protein